MVKAPDSASSGPGSSRPSQRSFYRGSCSRQLSPPSCIKGTGKFLLGGNPVMDQHPIQERGRGTGRGEGAESILIRRVLLLRIPELEQN